MQVSRFSLPSLSLWVPLKLQPSVQTLLHPRKGFGYLLSYFKPGGWHADQYFPLFISLCSSSEYTHSSVGPKISLACHFGEYIIISGFPRFFFHVSSLMGYRKNFISFSFPCLFLWFSVQTHFLLFNIPTWIRHVVWSPPPSPYIWLLKQRNRKEHYW